MKSHFCTALLSSLLAVGSPSSFSQTSKSKPPPTKGQQQAAGGSGQFGVTYTLKDNLNFVIYSAKYTLEPFDCQIWTAPKFNEKLFEIDLGFKNANPQDKAIVGGDIITLVDTAGQTYKTDNRYMSQDSLGSKGYISMLHPGQGIGQPGLHDPLHIIVVIPAKARIVKVLFHEGRKFVKPDEDMIRYYVAGATKEEAGEAGDPKNVIGSLPENAADSADKSGAIPLEEGKVAIGQELPSEEFHLKLNSASSTTDSLMSSPPKPGKKYVVLNVTATSMIDTEGSMSTLAGNFDPLWQLTDGDGETYKPAGFLKASSDDDAVHRFKLHDSYTFRVVFTVPKAASIKKIVIAAHQGHKWAFDGSIVQ